MQAAFRGPVEGEGYYATRTDLHEMLGQAWDVAGRAGARDSAVAHYKAVVDAWSGADDTVQPRRRAALARLQALGASR